ncbi:DUF192 domain-containing protein [Natronolimnobius sp. AArcel1]|uniref:DUF192 domain-containing protein n=1 Tax=Natronolimnobius sp. AArcel1 TaxID=1679093 RepID=UPI0013EC0A7D|nr:DUF192 domain-containing protein [Natronolimnobius sp. AArcel1]NGM70113.1 DUF192 domain-containing protein [Natronolimnobius sp. AArcel1]
MSLERSRRNLLGSLGASVAVVLAGCQTGDEEAGDTNSSAAEDGDERDPVDETETADDEEDTAGGEDETNDDESDTADADTVHADYETTDVRVVGPDGTERGAVTAAIADTSDLRYLGLSDTDELPTDRGMLFTYDSVADRTFVMREMDFGIDIIYADADGTITEIHHAPEPEPDEDGTDQRYPGRGQYILEVGYEWTAERNVNEGDRLEFDLEG